MNWTAMLVAILVLAASAVYGQTEEGEPSSQDSLETTEEIQVPDEYPDDTETVEDEEVQVEEEEFRLPSEPSEVLQSFLQALSTGDSVLVSQLISEEGLADVEIMLDILKENLDDNPETVMARLSAAGYTATADEIEDWSPMEYLTSTVVLPVMKARYSIYQMEIGDYSGGSDRLTVPLTFTTSAGVQLPFEAQLDKERDQWKVTDFIGLNSFP